MSDYNPVKKAYTKERYTQNQLDEVLKCEEDPFHFIENYCKVIEGTTGKEILFKTYPYQRKLIESAQANQYTVALFARQMGKTEAAVSYMLWFAMFNPNRNVLMVAHKYEHISEIMKRIKQVYELLPSWLKCGVLADGYNAKTIKFENGSQIKGTATTETSGRGSSIHLLYIDEFAFVPSNIAKEFWASVKPTLSTTKGKCIITSTPSNDDDEFAQIWHGAVNNLDDYGVETPDGLGRNGFKAIFADWRKHPDRDQAWADAEYASIGDERFRREFECEFISFDETLINPVFMNEEFPNMGKEPIRKIGAVRWYSGIKPNKIYAIALDPAIGTGGDNAAIQIYQFPEFIQVGEWCHNKTRIPEQIKIVQGILEYIAAEMVDTGMQVGEPELYWTVENNTIGEAALISIADLGEDNFPGSMLSESRRHGQAKVYRKGFNTTNKNKIEGASKLKTMVENKKLQVNSKALLRELKFFVAKGNSYAAKAGERDDLVMSTMLIIRMLQELSSWDDSILEAMSDFDLGDDYLEPMPTLVL